MSIRARLGCEWRTKLWMTLVLPAVFCAVYFTVQRFPLRTPRPVPVTWIDERLGFDVRWIYAYQSLYLLTPLPWLATSAAVLRAYRRGFVLMCAIGFLVFVFAPTSAPRPDVAATGLYAALIRIDTPLNACPSLHVGLAAYSVWFARRGLHVPSPAVGLLAAWAALIAVAALGLKQHAAFDLPPAVALAWVAQRWAFPGEKRP